MPKEADNTLKDKTMSSEPLIQGFTKCSIDRLIKADWNYKGDDTIMAEKLKANLERNGQVENIIIRELETGLYEIVNGNHRLEPMRELGITEVVVYNLGIVSLEIAQRLAFETNETAFPNNPDRMADIFRGLVPSFDLSDLTLTMPFSQTQIDGFMNPLVPKGKDVSFTASPFIHYDLVFDTTAQQDVFVSFLKTLKTQYPDTDTVAERLIRFIEASQLK